MERISTLSSLLTRYQKPKLIGAWSLYFIVVILGCIPGARMEAAQLGAGWVLHLLTYGFITCLLFSGTTGSIERKACMAVMSIAIMGALDESIQHFFPYRSAAFTDWLVDVSAGIFTSVILYGIWPASRMATRFEDTTALETE